MPRRALTSPVWPFLICAIAPLSVSAQPGACCFPNGSCSIIGEFSCTSHGGVFRGSNTTCAACGPTGACCIPESGIFYCQITTQASCTSLLGVFHGVGSQCNPTPCPPPPTGACCVPSLTPCQILSAPQCASQHGVYRGNNTTCTSCPCYANCDVSTVPPVLNVADFNCFIGRFAAGDSRANCDGSTVAPTLNIQDFVCFLNHFVAGC